MNSNTAPEQLAIAGTEDTRSNATPHMIARVNSIAIKIAAPFMAKGDIRYYLNGINIRPLEDGSVMVVATDGHRYVVARDQEGYCEREIIVSVSKDGLKHAAAGNTLDVMSNGDAKWLDKHAAPLFFQVGNSLIEGKFPRIENVASTLGYSEGISGAVMPQYLADALKIGEYFRSIRFFTKDDDSPLMFVAGGIADLEVFGGIMKLRDCFDGLPNWFPKPVPFELTEAPGSLLLTGAEDAPEDGLYDDAVQLVKAHKRASISLVQRHLRIGYNRAARLLDMMEQAGIVSAMQSNGNREILVSA
ncbi:DNA polymerase III beta subunit-like protein [Paucimonas lemoignei]|uniref:DNA polymerase III beta subunit-like protein n=1 Tax=Paucimonas lemoignei TaxID=29443 RepID=A0A4R3HYY8_PAULE|nr:DNA polymerase III beta subunit-like protein [Paucimonas lemoignei]